MALSKSYGSSIMFVTGLCAAAAAAVTIDGGWKYQLLSAGPTALDLSSGELEVQQPQEITASDIQDAKRAWRYIANNTQPDTGLVDSVAGFPSTTLWDQGSYILALVSAKQIGIVEDEEFHDRASRFLASFEKLPLFEGKLPNKVYDTRYLTMVDYANTPVPDGIGWSALDVARMLMAFRTLERFNPEYGDQIRALLSTWHLEEMAIQGELWGTTRTDGETTYNQEGRLGYEQYGARAAALWGMDVMQAVSAKRALQWVNIADVDVPTDARTFNVFHAITPILSEPYILQALELGLDSENRIMAERVYKAQENRFLETGIPTAVSEDHIDTTPSFLYSSVYANKEPWAVVSENGEFFPELRTLSVKAAFAWDAIYNTSYTDLLREEIADIGDAEKGWPAGIYESDNSLNETYTLNTNAVVIESIHHIGHGPLWSVR